MLKLIVNAEGKTQFDLIKALEEALRVIEKSGCKSGMDSNDDGGYDYIITGEEE